MTAAATTTVTPAVDLEQLLTWQPGRYPTRLRRTRQAGQRAPEFGHRYVGRCSRRNGGCAGGDCWGNPYRIGTTATVNGVEVTVKDAEQAVRLFWADITSPDPGFGMMGPWRDRVGELRGQPLMCWCPLPGRGQPDWCHAAVLTVLANPQHDLITPAGLDPQQVDALLDRLGWEFVAWGNGHRISRWRWPGDHHERGDSITVGHLPDAADYPDLMAGLVEALQYSAARGRQATQVLDALALAAVTGRPPQQLAEVNHAR